MNTPLDPTTVTFTRTPSGWVWTGQTLTATAWSYTDPDGVKMFAADIDYHGDDDQMHADLISADSLKSLVAMITAKEAAVLDGTYTV